MLWKLGAGKCEFAAKFDQSSVGRSPSGAYGPTIFDSI
jgi:hypothetical protein